MSSLHKPLVLKGSLQVGEIYSLLEFAKNAYDDYLYLNFDEYPNLAQFFEEDLDPNRIIKDLELTYKKTIQPESTLLILDEVQECPNALNSLKYFCEKRNDIHVAVAGSLLGVKLSKGFPVGKVNFIDINPLSFIEFLIAVDEELLADHLQNITAVTPLSPPLHTKLTKLLKYYFGFCQACTKIRANENHASLGPIT